MSESIAYNVRKKTDTELEVEIIGEDHTLGNLLAKRILEQKGVLMSYYRIEHPLKGSVIIYVKTDGSVSPIEVMKNAIDDTIKKVDALGAEIEEKLKSSKA